MRHASGWASLRALGSNLYTCHVYPQILLRANGIEMSKRQIAMGQNGDFSLNLTPATATQKRNSEVHLHSDMPTLAGNLLTAVT